MSSYQWRKAPDHSKLTSPPFNDANDYRIQNRKGSRRNEPCDCGSDKRRKHCCYPLNIPSFRDHPKWSPGLDREFGLKFQRLEAKEHERRIMQGLGKPIISETLSGYRIICVGSRIFYSQKWKTFVDFLFDYIIGILGVDWLKKEEAKPGSDQHPVLSWFFKTREFSRNNTARDKDGLIVGEPIGGMRALLALAYDLYLCEHNWQLPESLVKRLKKRDNFEGAVYEAFVIGCFARAGFAVEFEDESKGLVRHCEFVATHSVTQRQFSVEAKAVSGANFNQETRRLKLHRKISSALKKDAEHDRIAFIEVSQPDESGDDGVPLWVDAALEDVSAAETDQRVDLPKAYLFLTNRPFVHDLDLQHPKESVGATGFKIPDFPIGRIPQSFRDAICSRERDKELYGLMAAIDAHSNFPSSFDDELIEAAELANENNRLAIGKIYNVPNSSGELKSGRLLDAFVDEANSSAMGTYQLEDGTIIHAATPLSEEELKLYRRSPESFFGVLRQVQRQSKSPFELYDLLIETYSKSSKEKLIEFISKFPDAANLAQLSQPELAQEFCIRMAESIWGKRQQP